jgi:hypothetical protein
MVPLQLPTNTCGTRVVGGTVVVFGFAGPVVVDGMGVEIGTTCPPALLLKAIATATIAAIKAAPSVEIAPIQAALICASDAATQNHL